MITWADIEPPRPHCSYQLTSCPHCRHVVVRRLPENTYHRHVDDARAGREPLTRCPRCATEFYRRNRLN